MGQYCLVCGPAEISATDVAQIKAEVQSMAFAAVFALFFLVLTQGTPSTGVIGGLLISAPLVLVVHELGHAITARLVGFEAVWIKYGHGPVRWRWRMLGFGVEVRRVMWGGGLTYLHDPSFGAQRWRRALVDIAGPAVNLVLGIGFLVLGAQLDGDSGLPGLVLSLVGGFAMANILTGLFNLWPSGPTPDGYYSDGHNLWHGLFGERTAVTASDGDLLRTHSFMLAQDGPGVVQAASEGLGAAPEEFYHLSCALHWMSRLDGDEAALAFAAPHRPRVEAGANSTDVADQMHRAWVLANTAWCGVKSGRSGEAWVGRDLEGGALIADAAEYRLTKGAWLIETGETAAGADLLAVAVREVDDPVDKADACRFLGDARRRLGDPGLAEGYKAIGRHLSARRTP